MDYSKFLSLNARKIAENKALIDELKICYRELFGKELRAPCSGCTGYIDDALFEIGIYHKRKIQIKMASKYKLKNNVVLYVPKWHEHITNFNLTDEKAIALVKLNAKNAKLFEKAPVIEEEKPVVKEAKPAPVIEKKEITEKPVIKKKTITRKRKTTKKTKK